MDRIMELIEDNLGYRPDLEMDERGRWIIPQELIDKTNLPATRCISLKGFHRTKSNFGFFFVLGSSTLRPSPSWVASPNQ